MRVEIVSPVLHGGEVKRSGTLDVPETTAKHWISTGAAKSADVAKQEVNPPAVAPAAAADRGQKRF